MKKYYEYVWDIRFMIPNRKIEFSPYSLVSFKKTCDYFNSFIPIYEMDCMIEDQFLDYLRTFDKEIFVRIKQFAFSGENPEKLTDKQMIFEDTFAVYIDKTTIPSMSKQTRTGASGKPGNSAKNKFQENSINQRVPVKVHCNLLLRSDLQMRTYIHNYIFGTEESGASPMSAAVACININPYVKKFLADKPDNTEKYTDLIVEPGELKQVLYNIQRRYGIYSKSMLLFYDCGMLYMLNKLASKHSKQKDEIDLINVYLNEKNNTKIVRDATIFTDDKKIYYEREGALYKDDTESVSGILNGDKFVYSNFGTVINSMFANEGKTTVFSPLNEISRPRSSRVDVGSKKIIDYDMLNNPFNMSSYMYEQSKGVELTFALNSIFCDHFTPNKNIRLKFDNPESEKLYAGVYNIKRAQFIYTVLNRPNCRFRTYGHVGLTLCNKQDGYDKEYEPQKPD